MSRTAPSNDEVHDAFYVDYEAWQDGPPVVLGVLRVLDGVESFRQEVLHEECRTAAIAKNLTYSTARDSIERLANEVALAKATVIAWSQHELDDLFVPFGSTRAIEILSAAYRNAIPLAESWRGRCVPNWHPPDNSQTLYMAKTGYRVPTALGPNQTGQRLRAVRKMLISRDHNYRGLTHVGKVDQGPWTQRPRLPGHAPRLSGRGHAVLMMRP